MRRPVNPNVRRLVVDKTRHMLREDTCRNAFSVLLQVGCLVFFASLSFASPSAERLLKHKGFAWRSTTTEHLHLHFEANTLAETRIESLKLWQENAFIRNLQLLNATKYPYQTDTFIVSSWERMKELIGRETNGIAFPDMKIVCFIFNEKTNAGGAHELMHVMAQNLWTGKPKTWINEGFAVYADDQWWGYKLHDLNKYLLQTDRLIPLDKLIEHYTDYSDMIIYPESGSFVKYLYEQYGTDKVRQTLVKWWCKGFPARARQGSRDLGARLAQQIDGWRLDSNQI